MNFANKFPYQNYPFLEEAQYNGLTIILNGGKEYSSMSLIILLVLRKYVY